jgi:hypothetical protein
MMKNTLYCCFIAFCLLSCSSSKHHTPKGWVSLFDGKSLNNWKVGANAETFSVDSGMIIVHGKTAHLFYDGDVLNHNFRTPDLISKKREKALD